MSKLTLLATILCLIAVTAVAQEQVHVLESGDTVYTLARQYGVDASFLMEYNRITDPTRLAVGTRIRIPGTYTVKDGEYIYSIAQELGVSWIELLAVNDLDQDDVVRPGDILVIPGRLAVAENTDTNGSDDTQSNDTQSTDTVAGLGSENPENSTTVAATPVPGDVLVWPHPGERSHFDGRFRGIVMNAQPGDNFQSVATGVVSYVGPFTSFGKLILVRSEDGYLYGYAGADRVDITTGDRVANGTILGSVGYSPAFSATQVLFTVWRDNRYIDPETAPRG